MLGFVVVCITASQIWDFVGVCITVSLICCVVLVVIAMNIMYRLESCDHQAYFAFAAMEKNVAE